MMSSPSVVPLRSQICPSLLACDLSCMKEEAHRVLQSGADALHFDVMDGHFVPNLTWGAPVIASIRPHLPGAYFDVHMMVTEPERWVSAIAQAGGNRYTFHWESTSDPEKLMSLIRQAGMDVGVAIKPNTLVNDTILQFCAHVDLILVMTVEPGFGGQSFMGDMMSKVRQIRAAYPSLNIQVDGGLGPGTIDAAAQAGANVIVAGSSVFKARDSEEVIQLLRERVDVALLAST